METLLQLMISFLIHSTVFSAHVALSNYYQDLTLINTDLDDIWISSSSTLAKPINYSSNYLSQPNLPTNISISSFDILNFNFANNIENISNDEMNESLINANLASEILSPPSTALLTPSVKEQIKIIITGLFYGVAFILGAIGNGLIIYIVSHYARMRTLCNVFLASLATADLLLVCVCIPVKLVQLMTYTWTLGDFMCKTLHYVQNVSAFCSVLTLTTMSIERYYAILHPVECRTTFSMHHIQKIIILIWILALIMSAPVIPLYILFPVGDPTITGDDQAHFWCIKKSAVWASTPDVGVRWTAWRRTYELYQLCTILILPAIIMSYTYCRICTHLWSIVHRRSAIRYGNHQHYLQQEPQRNTNTKFGKINTKIIKGQKSTAASSTATMTTIATTISLNSNTAKKSSLSSSSASSSTASSTVSSNSSVAVNAAFCGTPAITSSTTKLAQRTMEDDNQTVKQVIRMLVAVVVLFVVCWAPMLIVNLLKSYNVISEINEGLLKEIVTITYLLAYFNSVLNPFIYGFMSKNFRLYFKQVAHQFCLRTIGCAWQPNGSSVKSTTKQQPQQSTNNKNNIIIKKQSNQRAAFNKAKNNAKDFAVRIEQHQIELEKRPTKYSTQLSSISSGNPGTAGIVNNLEANSSRKVVLVQYDIAKAKIGPCSALNLEKSTNVCHKILEAKTEKILMIDIDEETLAEGADPGQ